MSLTCINYNCQDELGAQRLNDCGYERQGGAANILLIECGFSLANPSSGTEINALVTAGNAQLIRNINFSYDYASAVEVDSNVPCSASRVANYDREATLIDRNVNQQSVTFYDTIFKGRRFSGILLFECGNEDQLKVRYINAVITASGSDRFPNNNNDFQDFKATFKWRSLTMAALYPAPVGVNGL